MESDLDLSNPIINRAFESLTDLLWDVSQEGPGDLDKIIGSLVYKLLKAGPESFDKFRDLFPPITEDLILSNQAYQTYLSTYPEQDRRKPKPFQVLVEEGVKSHYDQNFTLVYEGRKAEESVWKRLGQFKGKKLILFFNFIRPILFDLLKRREGFVDFVKALKWAIKDIIILLLESCSKRSMAKLGAWLTHQFFPLPIFYPIGKQNYKINLDCCLEVMSQAKKMLITSVGTPDTVNLGKSSLLSFLFSLNNPSLFSTSTDDTHSGSIDLYVQSSEKDSKCIIADINGYVENKEFQEMTSNLLRYSHLVLVHVSADDVCREIQDHATLATLADTMLSTKTNFIFLLGDYGEGAHNNLLNKISGPHDKYPNFHGTIPVPRWHPWNPFEDYYLQVKRREVLQRVTEVLDGLRDSPCYPIAELKKAYCGVDNKFEEEIKVIQNKLHEQSKENSVLYPSLFPCSWIDSLLNKELRKKKEMDIHRSEWTEAQVKEHSLEYEELCRVIESLRAERDKVEVSPLIQDICRILPYNEAAKILRLTKIINDWKTPRLEPIRKKYVEPCAERTNAEHNQRGILNQEIKRLEEEIDDKDITLDTFLDEIHSLYEAGKANNIPRIGGIKDFIYSTLKQGSPIKLVNCKTLKFGSKMLREIFESCDQTKKVYVISIIGSQGSAKSTLLNRLFGCEFAVSAGGRCTTGLYMTLLEYSNGCSLNNLIIIDTEGLLSVGEGGREFDHLIVRMVLSCSHVVIMNNSGGIDVKLKDLLEICFYEMKHLRSTNIRPKIFFAFRDILEDDPQELLIHIKSYIEITAERLMINTDDFIDVIEEDIFLLPSAFQFQTAENGSEVLLNNIVFSRRALEMRDYILQYLTAMDADNSYSKLSPGTFYDETEQLWSDIIAGMGCMLKAKGMPAVEDF